MSNKFTRDQYGCYVNGNITPPEVYYEMKCSDIEERLKEKEQEIKNKEHAIGLLREHNNVLKEKLEKIRKLCEIGIPPQTTTGAQLDVYVKRLHQIEEIAD